MKDRNTQREQGRRLPIVSLAIGIAALALFLVLLSLEVSHILSFALSLIFILGGNWLYTYILRRMNKGEDEKFTRSLGQIMLETVIKM